MVVQLSQYWVCDDKVQKSPKWKRKTFEFWHKKYAVNTRDYTINNKTFFVAIFKKKVFENHQKSINLPQREQRYLNFRAKKNLHIYRRNSSQFSFCNLHGVFFLRNIFWVVYSIFWFSLLLRCFSPFIFCCNSIKKGPLHTVSIKMRFYSECTDHIYDGNASRAV